MFKNTTLDWNKIYLSPHLATTDTTLHSFQYKILNSLLFLKKKLYTFERTNTALCSFCNAVEETPIHIFFDCIHVKSVWERLRMKFENDFILPSLTPQTAILGLYNKANDNYIYILREKRILNIDILIANLIKVKKREKQISIGTINKREAYKKSGALQITFYQ